MSKNFYAYHKQNDHGEFSGSTFFTDKNVVEIGDVLYVVSSKQDSQKKYLYYFEGCFKIAVVEANQDGSIERFAGKHFRLTLEPLSPVRTQVLLKEWFDKEFRMRHFSNFQFGVGALRPEVKQRFDSLMPITLFDDGLITDLSEIQSRMISRTEREIFINARVGQGKFRCDVAKAWGLGDVCALTGVSLSSALVASHIVPWSECDDQQRLDDANGIILVANADKLFDRHLISFKKDAKDEFTMVCKPEVRSHLLSLGLRDGQRLNTAYLSPSYMRRLSGYMAEHFSRFRG